MISTINTQSWMVFLVASRSTLINSFLTSCLLGADRHSGTTQMAKIQLTITFFPLFFLKHILTENSIGVFRIRCVNTGISALSNLRRCQF